MGGFNSVQDWADQVAALRGSTPSPQLDTLNQMPQNQVQPPPPTPGANPQADSTSPSASGGPVKKGLRGVLAEMLQNFSYGAGQAMKADAGLPTDQQLAMQQAQLAHLNAQTQMVQQQAEQMRNLYPVTLPDGSTIHVPQALAGKVIEAQVKGQYGVQAAGTSKRYVVVPNVGVLDTQPDNGGSAQLISGTAGGITITPEIAAQYKLPQEYIGKPMSLQQLAAVERGSVFQNTPMMTASGPIVVNRQNSTATPVTGPNGQRYSPPSLATPKEVADPNNPGQTIIVPAGQSFGQAGTQSASVQVPRAAIKGEVPSNIGNQRLAFNTAIAHADLLRDSLKALRNGDQQTLNALQNKFSTEFGESGPITAQAIADAYSHETQKMLGGGHVTQADLDKVGSTLDVTRQSPEQSESIIRAYHDLAASKVVQLDKQIQTAVTKSQPSRVPKAVQQRMNKSSNDPLGLR